MGTTRLLLVEDDPVCQLPTRIMLQRRGFFVDVASNGAAALELIAHHGDDYDIIILDLFMPVMDGYAFMRTYGGRALIIVLSGWADLDNGVFPIVPAGCIAKPYSTVDLCDAINRIVENRA
jgi:CheY-like chemotaxis protein